MYAIFRVLDDVLSSVFIVSGHSWCEEYLARRVTEIGHNLLSYCSPSRHQLDILIRAIFLSNNGIPASHIEVNAAIQIQNTVDKCLWSWTCWTVCWCPLPIIMER
jgi:hypothetical protein